MTNREWGISESGIYSPYDHNEDGYIRDLENKIDKIEKEKYDLEYLLEDYEDKLTFFIRNFIELGNHEKTFHDAYAKLFEIYKGYGYEKYYQENK